MQGENEGFTENNQSKEFTEFNQTEGFTVYKEIFDPTRPPSIKGKQLYNPRRVINYKNVKRNRRVFEVLRFIHG